MKKTAVVAICLLLLILISLFAREYLRVRNTNALHHAVYQNDLDKVKGLLASGAGVSQINEERAFGIRIWAFPYKYERNVTPLYVAVSNSNLSLVKVLIERGADVNLTGDNYSPLGRAITMLIPSEDPADATKIIELLVRSGADIHWGGGRKSESPLQMTERLRLDDLHDSLLVWARERVDDPNQRIQRAGSR